MRSVSARLRLTHWHSYRSDEQMKVCGPIDEAKNHTVNASPFPTSLSVSSEGELAIASSDTPFAVHAQ